MNRGSSITALAILILLIACGELLWNQWTYGDWTCALKECRVIKESP